MNVIDRNLAQLVLKESFRTGDDDLVEDFYAPCIRQAIRYDRAVGYFRSSVFVVAVPALLEFVRRGGKMRVVCSPELTEADVTAMAGGYELRREAVEKAVLREIEWLLSQVMYESQTSALATMIELGVLDIRIAFRREGLGIYHEKLGIFEDDASNAVSFKGSSNETFYAWHSSGNVESFDVFCSWRSNDSRRVSNHRMDFNRLWCGNAEKLDVIPFPEVARERLRTVAKDHIEEITPRDIADPRHLYSNKPERKPFQHQVDAITAWRQAGRRGIFEHATGSGKTFSALLAIDEHLRHGGVALVLVPSELLLKQWTGEAREMMPDAAVLMAGAGNDTWKKPGRLSAFTSPEQSLGRRILIATLQTASKAAFYKRIRGGDHLLLVIDEVHKAGSPQHSRVFNIEAGPRLGLSATPRRYGDPDGTGRIFAYFNEVVPPVFTLEDALKGDPPRLVPYQYQPHEVRLNPDEVQRYEAFTIQIRREYARHATGSKSDERSPITGRLKHLLIRRARIVKKAQAKVDLAVRVLTEFAEGQHWLVYCEDTEQVDEVLTAIQTMGLPAQAYHTRMHGDSEGTLQWFRDYGGVLVSIRCLDEGVDIPQISHALILASSQNPREFIQRRGRVLRIAPERYGKRLAVIHDALVVPDTLLDEPAGASIMRAELARALQFARAALNAEVAEALLLDIALKMRLNLDAYLDDGMEDDSEDEST